MREFKFRGKTINGEWEYGNLAIISRKIGIIEAGSYISNRVGLPFSYQVRSETVGQYIGLEDSNGNEIYEDDIVKITYFVKGFGIETEQETVVARIVFRVECSAYALYWINSNGFEDGWYLSDMEYEHIEVVGNCHDSPELIKN
jgi:uncharacterized phage protein (TIGR01671 family)